MEWKKYKNYEISEYGDVWSNPTNSDANKRGKHRKVSMNRSGHLQVGLYYDGKVNIKKIHRLVYELFISDIPDGYDVHHKDENKLNNHYNNLEIIYHNEHTKLHKKGIKWNKHTYKIKEKVKKDRTLNKTTDMKEYQKKWKLEHPDYFKNYYRMKIISNNNSIFNIIK